MEEEKFSNGACMTQYVSAAVTIKSLQRVTLNDTGEEKLF
jgi:hypothetical protein